MLGYLRTETPGALRPPPDGWYDTGDVVTVSPDGFVTIKGRAKRFAKIAGEMVSLAAVEALAESAWPGANCAALTLPDPRKGERVVLVTDRPGAARPDLTAAARDRGVPELFVPAEVLAIDRLPLLASGKIDHPALRRLAEAPAAA